MNSIVDFLIANSSLINSISSLFVIASAIFVGFQSKLFFSDYNKRHKKEGFENSFKLTQYYIKNIIPHMDIILEVFKLIGLENTLRKSLKNQNLSDFDVEEFASIFDNVTLKSLLDAINGIDLQILLRTLDKGSDMLPGSLEQDYHSYLKCHECQSDRQKEKCNELYRKMLVKRFTDLLTTTKNEIEYFSMYFNSNLAEEEVIYDSLHQTFIDFVRILYPFISMHNTKSVHGRKYFTNTIELYKRWNDKENLVATKARTVISAIEQGDIKHKKI